MEFRGELQRAAAEFGTPLTEEQAEQFSLYYELLLEWNGKMNLTAITEPREVAAKHVVDSLSAFDGTLFREGVRVIDVGSGAGFPGLALKIYFPSMEIVLLDSLQKRVKFLETVVSALGLSGVSCVHGRAEEAARRRSTGNSSIWLWRGRWRGFPYWRNTRCLSCASGVRCLR